MAKIIFFGGKGGVGKTTCSAAYASKCAKKGLKTLLVSTDPAHSIADIFEKPIGRAISNIETNLDGIEIDAAYESQQYIQQIRGQLGHIVSPIIIDEINRQLDAASVSPGTYESALFDKMVELINLAAQSYDHIIFDTAPTGHTLRLVTLPELLGRWMETLIGKREKALKLSQMIQKKGIDQEQLKEDPIIKILSKRKVNMEKAREILIDNKQMAYIYVLNAEKLPIEETKKAIDILEENHIQVNALIVNRILPEDSKDDFLIAKKNMEKIHLEKIRQLFKGKTLYFIPWMTEEPTRDKLKTLEGYLDL